MIQKYLNEEGKVIAIENDSNLDSYCVYDKIPYDLIREELSENQDSQELFDEFADIINNYNIYKRGIGFSSDVSKQDFLPANLRYKMCATLIDKEARFLFSKKPDINIVSKADTGKASKEVKDVITNFNELLKSIFDSNMFENELLKAAKDCFIGKRVAGLVNFNEDDGVTISFIPSTQFIYETMPNNVNEITKFVCFMFLNDCRNRADRRIFKKKYTVENGKVYLEEKIYNGLNQELEEVFKKQEVKLKKIPVAIFINDGLLGDKDGESEITNLKNFEMWYSKMANGDLDAERTSMSPIRYTVDMDYKSTAKLSSSPGSFWDLISDQNLDTKSPSVGVIESSMGYSTSLETSLNRIKTNGYEMIDIPNINLETMSGVITSGKALKAIYWPLIVRCEEKMKMWGPQLRKMVEVIIDGSLLYPNCVKKYIDKILIPVKYSVEVQNVLPLPEDEVEEKNLDMSQVESKVMSRKSYIKKWFNLNDDEAQAELEQIAMERQLLEDFAFGMPNEGVEQIESQNEETDIQDEEQEETAEDEAEMMQDEEFESEDEETL